MNVTFLGTSSMTPTKTRGQSGIYVDCGKEKILLDCGENIQRQMRIIGISPPKTTRIFISHWHGDHVFGLPGLLENIAKNAFEKKIEIYGNAEVKKRLNQLVKAFDLNHKLKINFNLIEKNGIFLKTDDYEFGAYLLKHGTPCLGYYIKEKDRICVDKAKMKKVGLPSGPIIRKIKSKKDVTFKGKKIKWKDVTYLKEGKKIAVLLDTGICRSAISLAKNSDLLICESTYLDERKENAIKYNHLTSGQCGEIATKSGSKKVIITHFSQRYEKEDIAKMKKEVKKEFKGKVDAAEDFMIVEV